MEFKRYKVWQIEHTQGRVHLGPNCARLALTPVGALVQYTRTLDFDKESVPDGVCTLCWRHRDSRSTEV